MSLRIGIGISIVDGGRLKPPPPSPPERPDTAPANDSQQEPQKQ